MTNTNYPSATPQSQPTRSSNSKNIVIGLLAVALLGSWAYFLMKINKSDKEIISKTEEGVHYMSQRDSLESLYKFTLDKYDSVTVANNDLSGKLTTRQTEISKLKGEISSILRKKNLSAAELKTAKGKIDELNEKITNLEAEVARLTTENQTLTTANTTLTTEKETLQTNLTTKEAENKVLTETVDVGSTFSASNIRIVPVNEKNGGKEKETTTAKRVDKLMVSFDVENRITKSGPTDMYIIVTAPDGKVVTTDGGNFTTRTEGDKSFTYKTTVNYEQGTRQNVQIPVVQEKFLTGDYKIEVYQNGFKIGEGVRSLKKGGLFS